MADYYLKYNDRVSGPFPIDTLKTMARDGLVTSVHALSLDKEQWFPADQIPGLLEPPTPPATPNEATAALAVSAAPSATPANEAAPSPAASGSSASSGPSGQPGAPGKTLSENLGQVAGKVGTLLNSDGKIETKPAVIAGLVMLGILVITLVVGVFYANAMSVVGERLSMGYYINPVNYMQGHSDEARIRDLSTLGNILAILTALASLAYLVAWIIPLYQCWKRVQPLRAEHPDMPSPLRATGFLFIPFYNFYWVFHSLIALGRYLSLMVHRLDPACPSTENPVIRGLAITLGVLMAFTTLVAVVAGQGAFTLLLNAAQLLCSLFYIRVAANVANLLPRSGNVEQTA